MSSTPTAPACYRHPERETHVRCQRCERPICPDCMRQASVGFHCPECAGGNKAQVMTGAQVLRRTETPIVTNVLIALNLAAFLWSLVNGTDMGETLYAMGVMGGFMLALGCIQALQCHTNKCPTGIATRTSSTGSTDRP